MLQSDRLIKIYVGEMTKPFLIQAALLDAHFFVCALKNQDAFGGEKDALKFPEDDQGAWEMFLHWKMRGNLLCAQGPEADPDADQLVRSWIHGDKYGIPQFQDDVMWQLIQLFALRTVDISTVKLAFDNTPVKSPLRRLMAEELVFATEDSEHHASVDLDFFDGVVGFSAELMRTMKRREKYPSGIGMLVDRRDYPPRLAKFMVGDGPKGHWVTDDNSSSI